MFRNYVKVAFDLSLSSEYGIIDVYILFSNRPCPDSADSQLPIDQGRNCQSNKSPPLRVISKQEVKNGKS